MEGFERNKEKTGKIRKNKICTCVPLKRYITTALAGVKQGVRKNTRTAKGGHAYRFSGRDPEQFFV